MLKSTLAKAATAKAAIVLAAVGGGGVALAAGSGHLPGGAASHDHAAGRPSAAITASEHATAAAAHGAPGAAANGSPSGEAHGAPSGDARDSAAPDASPSPNLRGLCTAFQAGVGDNPGKALDNPAFTVLINTAGGKDGVANYCTTLLATPAGAPATHASGRSHPHPTEVPSSHPSAPGQAPSHPEPPALPTHAH